MEPFLIEYFERQRENAKFKNRIRFLIGNYKHLSTKQVVKYFFIYSPSINQLPLGAKIAEGFAEGLREGFNE